MLNPLAVIDEYTRKNSGNLIFLWSTPKSIATHAPESGLISTDAKSKYSKFHQKRMAVKGLNRRKKMEKIEFFQIFV